MSLTKEDFQAFEQMMDTKLSQLDKRFDEKLSQQDRRFDEKLAQQKKEILAESAHNTRVLLESYVEPKFNLLAEGQQIILEKLVPRSRVDELDEELKFLKSIVRQINEDLQLLKKAN